MAKASGDDDLFPDEVEDDGRYPHPYWDLPHPAAKEIANLIMKSVGELMTIARLWPRQYALEVLVAREKRIATDGENEMLGGMFGAWIDFQGHQSAIIKRIQDGGAMRAGDAWAKEMLDALDTAHREFNSNPIDPAGNDEAVRAGMQEEIARAQRFMKLADRLYDSYRHLAYAYLVPRAEPGAVESGSAVSASKGQRLTEREGTILEALGDKTLTAEQISRASGYRNNSSFRDLLSQMVKRNILVRVDGRAGYRRA